uniref:Uncharacterized protein n=1 Tax=candidate division WOR-3 bacterium TaxID=2052148 RepID=A0A7C4TB58_UNCW3
MGITQTRNRPVVADRHTYWRFTLQNYLFTKLYGKPSARIIHTHYHCEPEPKARAWQSLHLCHCESSSIINGRDEAIPLRLLIRQTVW